MFVFINSNSRDICTILKLKKMFFPLYLRDRVSVQMNGNDTFKNVKKRNKGLQMFGNDESLNILM